MMLLDITTPSPAVIIEAIAGLVLLLLLPRLLGIRYIPNNRVGIVEKLWSVKGSLTEGRILALGGEAGFQARILRGGLHFGFFAWQYRLHKEPLVTIGEGKIGYVYSRDGQPLPPTQTLGRVVDCNNFQDARAFLSGGGQRGRQRGILREGVYAINLSLFVVVTENLVYSGPIQESEQAKYRTWQGQMLEIAGFDPILIGHGAATATETQEERDAADNIGVVSVHDGDSIGSGEIIAPEVAPAAGHKGHNYFQDPETFLELGGRRGKQLQVLTDGTFFINRWFATVEMRPKTVIPIGYVGVVVSYYGSKGEDLSGIAFRYGEQVEPGHRGVWKMALPPGKFALNPFALKVELVPTVNFVLRWITGVMEEHQYDKDLKSISLITADGYEPILPLSLVLHIDYEKAPSVVQRFGDIKRLISQTLDPIISAYFRDVAQSTQMLDLLTKREEIQQRATSELGRRFRDYDINCVAVLIGRPESQMDAARADQDPIQRLFEQLRMRRLSNEQIETFRKQEEAANKLKELNEAQASAQRQTELTQTRIEIEIAGNRGGAQLAEARQLAQRDIARAEGESKSKELLGRGEASRVSQVGLAEATVNLKKIQAYGDPRLFTLNLVTEQLAKSLQPLVPQSLMMMGGGGADGAGSMNSTSLAGNLIGLLLAEKGGLKLSLGGAGDAGAAPGSSDVPPAAPAAT
jgi:uncharacterized membrane protein YqiK